MIIPPPLQKGDKIGIVATARKISEAELQPAVQLLQNWGFEAVFAPNLFAANHQFAGTEEQKIADFNYMLSQPDIKAIICARGGYGSVRMVDGINGQLLQQNPKWVIGYSDVTVLHNHINKVFGVATLHATMPINMDGENAAKQGAQNSLQAILTGNMPQYPMHQHPLNRKGNAAGVLTGGNLSVLYSLLGSVSFPETEGKILFLEDLDEYLYHIDRMMMGLKRANKLSNLAALVVGGMTDMRDNTVPFGKTAEEIIYQTVQEYNYPVYFNFPAGHIDNNLALPMSITAKIENNSLVFAG